MGLSIVFPVDRCDHYLCESPLFDRLASECIQRCEALSRHTEIPGTITRRFLTPPMRSVHDEVTAWMEAASMTVVVDDGGNLRGIRASSDPLAKTLVIGSHLDTIPNGGKYDGILGVMVGIAVMQAFQSEPLPFNVMVVGFSEEEGVRFSFPYIGSHAVAGTFDPEWLSRADDQNLSLAAVIESFGLSPRNISSAALDPSQILGFVETHIEQGPVLACDDLPVAAVGAIAGQTRLQVAFHGRAAHAGTTPMTIRQDALIPAATWIADVSRAAAEVADLRATVGCVSVSPGARNVIPGSVELSLDVRHGVDAVRDDAVANLIASAERLAKDGNVSFEVLDRQTQPAAIMDANLTDGMLHSIQTTGHRATTMLSGAGHDAAIMARRFPTAMLFIRQPHGISHHPDEDVQAADVAVAIEVLVNLIKRLVP